MDITNTLKAIIILDSDGKRIISRCFDEKTNSRQFEKKLFIKTKAPRMRDDILVIDNTLIVHKFVTDIHIYVVGNKNENPLILDSVLNCLVESITSLLNKSVERQTVFGHLSKVILALDETCDNGLIFETDSNLVTQRVILKDEVAEQSMAQKIQGATEYIRFPWIRS